MAKQEDIFKNVISHAKSTDLFFRQAEIYDGFGAVMITKRVELKKEHTRILVEAMVQLNDNIVGLDASLLMHPTTLGKHQVTLMLSMIH
jgi:glycyl-tRNA synthetase